jgi:hypothetical protein
MTDLSKLVKPLDLSEPSFVIHASGALTFFASSWDAEQYADSLGRYSYLYDAEMLKKHGEKLKVAHDEWVAETKKLHTTHIIAALDPEALAQWRDEAVQAEREACADAVRRLEDGWYDCISAEYHPHSAAQMKMHSIRAIRARKGGEA